MYPAFDWSSLRRAMDISVRATLLPDRPGVGHVGHPCSGFQADLVIFLIDEASGVADVIFEVALGAMSGENAIAILTSIRPADRAFFTQRILGCHIWHPRA